MVGGEAGLVASNGRVPVGSRPRLSSQSRWVIRPTRMNRSKAYGLLSDGKNVGVERIWKCRCGVVELPLLPMRPSC